MRKDNIIWTEIPNRDVLRFGDISHNQRKKGITSINDYTEAYLRCEDCDRATKIKKVGLTWDIKGWKSFIRKAPVFKDPQTGGYRFYTQIEFYCPSCVEKGR